MNDLEDYLLQEPGEAKLEYEKFKQAPDQYLTGGGFSINVEEAHEIFTNFIKEGEEFWEEEDKIMRDFHKYWTAREEFIATRDPGDTSKYYLSLFSGVVEELRKLGITEASCEFYGSGDSGDFDGVTLWKGSEIYKQPAEIPYSKFIVKVREMDYDETTNKVSWKHHDRFMVDPWRPYPTDNEQDSDLWQRKDPNSKVDIRDAIEGVVSLVLDDTDVDWYNNEGGGGEATLCIKEDTFTLNLRVYQNVVEQIERIDTEFK